MGARRAMCARTDSALPPARRRSTFSAALIPVALAVLARSTERKTCLTMSSSTSCPAAVPSLEAGLLHQGAIALPDRAFHALYHRERYHSAAADVLLRLISASPAIC